MQATFTNPRITATIDLQLEGGASVSVTVPRDANELQIMQLAKEQIANASTVAVAAGLDPIPVPSDEDLVPALAALRRLDGETRDL